MAKADETGGALPETHKAGWGQFIKSLAGWSGDLSSLTAPSFILSPVSLTEFPAYWAEHPNEFAAISSGKTPAERAALVFKWFILTLKGQYTTRNEKMGSEKKPLNPILGETFLGRWPDQGGRGETILVVEQVSHHPPITAYHITNPTAGVTLTGHSGQKTSFSAPSIIVKQVGHATLTVRTPEGGEEKYLITLPRLRIDGLLLGSPYIELSDASYIIGSNGFVSTIDYKGKGWLSGKAHSYKATLKSPSGEVLHTVEGQWTGVSKDTKSPSSSLNFDANIPKEEVHVKAVEEQGPTESRRVWKDVADGIRAGDYDKAGVAKSKLENEQREKRKNEAAAGTPHQLVYFEHHDADLDYTNLITAVSSLSIPATEDKYAFRPEAAPTV